MLYGRNATGGVVNLVSANPMQLFRVRHCPNLPILTEFEVPRTGAPAI
jgi:hypothetical protein